MSSSSPILHENLPLIEVADGVLLDLISADPQARKLILVRLSERAAIVAPGGFDAPWWRSGAGAFVAFRSGWIAFNWTRFRRTCVGPAWKSPRS